MRKIKEVLRLYSLGLAQRQIARSCSLGQSTVSEYLKVAEAAGLEWPQVAAWDDGRLAAALIAEPAARPRPGRTIPVQDPATGEVREAQLFLAVLGASNYTYAEATWTQALGEWIGSHIRAFEFFGGVPEIVVPDNLKSGVTKACRYEPGVNLRGTR